MAVWQRWVKSAAGITDDDPREDAKQKADRLAAGDEAIAESSLVYRAGGRSNCVAGERGAPEIAWDAREFADEWQGRPAGWGDYAPDHPDLPHRRMHEVSQRRLVASA